MAAVAGTAVWSVALMGFIISMVAMAEQVQRDAKIVGGVVTTGDDYPWIVSFQYKPVEADCGYAIQAFCTGSVIDGDKNGFSYFLSAAHCFLDWHKTLADRNDQTGCTWDIWADIARNKKYDSSETGYESVKITGVFFHPDYASRRRANDVCVVRSDETVQAEAVTLQTTPNCCQAGDQVRAIGYGEVASDPLEYVDMEYITAAKCREDGYTTNDGMLCTFDSGNGTCSGDEGGPLIRGTDKTGIQIGITSSCFYSERANVYIDVGYYYEWIIAAMNDEDFEDDPFGEVKDCNYCFLSNNLWAVGECNYYPGRDSSRIECENGRPMLYRYDSLDCSGATSEEYDMITESSSLGDYKCDGSDGNCDSLQYTIEDYNDDECSDLDYVANVHFVQGCVLTEYGPKYTTCVNGNYKYVDFEVDNNDCSGIPTYVTEIDKDQCNDYSLKTKISCGNSTVPIGNGASPLPHIRWMVIVFSVMICFIC